MKERESWFDFLRGVAVLMVIAIHTFAATSQKEEMVGDALIVSRQMLNCAVPLFLAISGYFLAKKQGERSYARFLKHQIPKIYIPTLIWSLPYWALYVWQGNDWMKGMILFLACGFSIYYFIALIIQYYVLLPVLRKVNMGGGNFSIRYHYGGYNTSHLFRFSQRIWHEFLGKGWPVSRMAPVFCDGGLYRQ